MDPALLAELHPRLFHMAAARAWPQIARHGLLSTAAILDLAGVDGDRREALEAQRRPDSVTVQTPAGDTFVLRDQKPLHPAKLSACLTDMTLPEWLRLLNSKVFFWPSRRRCEHLLGAKAYRDRPHTIIEVDTAALLDRYAERVTVSRINAGAVLYNPPPRGSRTFLPIADVPFDQWRQKRSRRRAIAEVAVEYAVPDVEAVTVAVWQAADGKEWRHA